MSEGRITVELRDHVLWMGIDRAAKRNAFTPALYRALGEAYQRLDSDDEARVGLLYAHGEHFTGGLDLAQFVGPFRDGKMPLSEGGLDPLGLATRPVKKPVVCAVQGICYTIGIELLLATDVRVAASSARFGQIEVKRGIYPVGGATIRMPRELGWGNAMRWLLTGDELDAAEAQRMGLVQEVVPTEQLLPRAAALCATIAAQAPLGVQATLASARLTAREGEAAAAARLFPDLAPILASTDAAEGLQSFLERRPARFTGK